MQDPGRYLKQVGVQLRCPVEKSRWAVLDSLHVARVNHETYYFSSDEARRRFLEEPLRWCGRVTNPVTGVRFRPGRRSPQTVYGGRPYYFPNATAQQAFLRDPARYAEPLRRMDH